MSSHILACNIYSSKAFIILFTSSSTEMESMVFAGTHVPEDENVFWFAHVYSL